MRKRRSCIHSSTRGFTLAEMLIASTVLAIIAGGIFSLLFQSQDAYQSQQNIIEVTQTARIAIDQIIRFLRQAGNDSEEYLKNNNIPSVEILGSEHIRINSDITGAVPDAGADPLKATGDPDGTLANRYERVVFRYDDPTDTLYVDLGNGEQILAENITVDFTFYDMSGAVTADENEIVRVRVELKAETEDADRLTGKIQSITLRSDVMLRSKSFDVFAMES
ncbi:prepilin-type N-terminal cleavage/methylation domain-containing protein [Acidobacteria bacterium AH-259-D05]|nr:prepilin-type N-terminal cleavage/methylation domain-containing protein [Acidobacteria bacterium AH-259-D05]